MAFPLATVLAAAPGLISTATDIIRLIKQKKTSAPLPDDKARLDELVNLLEQQAQVIEELAVNNRNMAIAVRNNRVFSLIALLMSAIMLGVVIFVK